MLTIKNAYPHKLMTPEKADALAESLNLEDADALYVAKHDPRGTGLSFVALYDEDGELIGEL